MKAVTSFSTEGYELYGKTFLETYVKYWPIPITVYYEEKKPDFEHELVSYKSLFDIAGCIPFLETMGTLPIFQGLIGGKRDYRYDVFRFSRKMFAQSDAATEYQGKLFWVDADIETNDYIPEAWLEKTLNTEFMCYMGRPDWHSCASFVGWDCSHPQAAQFWEVYYGMHISGQIFLLPEWHDSYILDTLRKNMKLESKNLAEGLDLGKGPVNVFDEVFKGRAHHKKGNLKFKEAV